MITPEPTSVQKALARIIDDSRGSFEAASRIIEFFALESVHVWWCDDRKLAKENGFEEEGDYRECSREAFPCGLNCGCGWIVDLQEH